MVIYIQMGREIDEKTLQKAKEKLACKIEPAKFTDGSLSAGSSRESEGPQLTQQAVSDFIGIDGQVFLTRMTTAGG